MKVKLFTHNDADGAGCAIIAKLAFGPINVDVEYCDYSNINESVEKYINTKDYLNYSETFVTDISVSKEVMELVEKTSKDNIENIGDCKSLMSSFTLIDHHKTALHLNEYYNCVVMSETEGLKHCGTELFHMVLNNSFDLTINTDIINSSVIKRFIERIRRYDTWEWKALNDTRAKEYTDLLQILDIYKFVDLIVSKVLTSDNLDKLVLIGDYEKELIDISNNMIEKYIEEKKKNVYINRLNGFNVAFVFAEQHFSQLGNALLEDNKDVDYVMMINPGRNISLRSREGSDVDVSVIADSMFGGGGHKHAAGATLEKSNLEDLLFGFIYFNEDEL